MTPVLEAVFYLSYGTSRFAPTLWGKLTTLSELITVSLFLLFNALNRHHVVLDVAVWLTLVLILISGFNYLWRTLRHVRTTEPPPGTGSRE